MPWDEDRHVEYALAGWLRQKRRSLDMEQKDIAAAVNVSKVTVHLWETSGRCPGTYARWNAWAKAVNCRIEITVVDTDGKRHTF